jgi:hypothetical protein
MYKPTDFLLVVISVACLGCAVVLMPWSELNFGADPHQLTTWGKALCEMPPMNGLSNLAQQVTTYLKANGAESNFGDYMYALVIFGILTLLGLVFMAVGREEAEEKTVLPVK